MRFGVLGDGNLGVLGGQIWGLLGQKFGFFWGGIWGVDFGVNSRDLGSEIGLFGGVLWVEICGFFGMEIWVFLVKYGVFWV